MEEGTVKDSTYHNMPMVVDEDEQEMKHGEGKADVTNVVLLRR